jgi:predicted RNA-binding protein YlxR (DUF448 family)
MERKESQEAITIAVGPIRMCVGCRRRRPQGELFRVARRADGSVHVDAGQRGPGRGAYVCPDVHCVVRAIDSGGLRRALKHEGALPDTLRADLLATVGERQK